LISGIDYIWTLPDDSGYFASQPGLDSFVYFRHWKTSVFHGFEIVEFKVRQQRAPAHPPASSLIIVFHLLFLATLVCCCTNLLNVFVRQLLFPQGINPHSDIANWCANF
jgi:hypothetical protein